MYFYMYAFISCYIVCMYSQILGMHLCMHAFIARYIACMYLFLYKVALIVFLQSNDPGLSH